MTLTTIDTFLILGALVIALLIAVALIPTRTYPPRLLQAAH